MRRIDGLTALSMALLSSASAALAQAGPPVDGAQPSTPDAAADGGSTWWWLIALAVVAVVAIWYLAQRRNRP